MFWTGKFFFISLLFIILSNRDFINFVIIVLLLGRKIILAAVASFVTFLPEMVSCSFKIVRYFNLNFESSLSSSSMTSSSYSSCDIRDVG